MMEWWEVGGLVMAGGVFEGEKHDEGKQHASLLNGACTNRGHSFGLVA